MLVCGNAVAYSAAQSEGTAPSATATQTGPKHPLYALADYGVQSTRRKAGAERMMSQVLHICESPALHSQG